MLMLQVILLRLRYMLTRSRRYKLLTKWRPVLTAVVMGLDPVIPSLPKKHTRDFLVEWNRYHATVKGKHLEMLIRLAHRLHFGYYSRNLILSRNIRKKLFGITTLGHMREYAAWDELVALLSHAHTMVSLTAARSLVQIDAKRAIDILLPKILTRNDWPWANVAHILQQAPSEQVCDKLAAAVLDAPLEKQASFLRFLEQTRCLQLTRVTSQILSNSEQDHIITVCLHINTDPKMIDIVRKYCAHSRWHVRMHAATALGRIGEHQDIEQLLQLTSDREWWVRYRAASALAGLPCVSDADLAKLIDTRQDKFSKDILIQIQAEKLNNDIV